MLSVFNPGDWLPVITLRIVQKNPVEPGRRFIAVPKNSGASDFVFKRITCCFRVCYDG
jgi:hypothetical protein